MENQDETMSHPTKDKHALLTGAAGGLGQAFALRLAEAGYRLLLSDRGDCSALQAEIARRGGHAQVLNADLADAASVQALAQAALQASGGCVDVLVNNAAAMDMLPLQQMPLQTWRLIMTVNIEAPMLLAQGLAPAMAAQRWGRIVNLASSTTWGPPPGMGAYACSKLGVIGLTRALAAELGPQGITVNAISPGLTRHAGTEANLPAGAFDAVRQRQFIPRTEEPADLIGTLAFLCSDEARFITGQVLNVDGGGFGF